MTSQSYPERLIYWFRDNWYHVVLLIVVAAFLIRSYNLGAAPAWADEGRYIMAADRMLEQRELLPRYPASDIRMGGKRFPFFALLGIIGEVTGQSLYYARMISVVSGSLLIVLIFSLGKYLYNRRVGVFAALLMAVESNHVLYSREALPHMFGVLTLTAAMYTIIRLSRSPSLRSSGLSVFTGVIATLMHQANAIIALIYPLVVGVRSRHTRISRRQLRVAIISILVLLVTVVAVQKAVSAVALGETETHPELRGFSLESGIVSLGLLLRSVVSQPLHEYLSSTAAIQAYYFNASYLYLPLLLFMIPFAYGVIKYWGQQESVLIADQDAILYGWYAATVVGVGVLAYALFTPHLPVTRGQIFLLPPLILLMARGSDILVRWRRPSAVIIIILILAYLAHLPVMLTGTMLTIPAAGSVSPGDYTARTASIVCADEHYRPLFCFDRHPVGYDDTKDWREVTRYITNTARQNTTIYLSMPGPFLYYADGAENQYRIQGLVCNVDHRRCNLSAALQTEGSVWIVTDPYRSQWQLTAEENAYLNRRCVESEVSGILVYRCGV